MTLVQYALVVMPVGTNWSIEPVALTGLVGSAILYIAAVGRLRQKGRRWPVRRSIAFGAGLLAIFLATHSPLAAQDTRLFSAHVGQHLLLGMTAPPLLCLGAPITLWLQGARRPTQERLLRVLHSPLIRLVTTPIVTWMLFTGTLFILYFSPLYDLSLRNPLAHELMHFHFVVAGFLFFAPIVAIDPHPHRLPHGARLFYMGLTLPAHAFLALALLSAANPLAADWYLTETGRSLDQVLTDQRLGAALMWVSGDLLSIAAVAIVVIQWARDDERSAAREDKFVDRERADSERANTGYEDSRTTV